MVAPKKKLVWRCFPRLPWLPSFFLQSTFQERHRWRPGTQISEGDWSFGEGAVFFSGGSVVSSSVKTGMEDRAAKRRVFGVVCLEWFAFQGMFIREIGLD